MKDCRGLVLAFVLTAVLVLTSCGDSEKIETNPEARYLNPIFERADVIKDIAYSEITEGDVPGRKSLDLYQPEGDKENSRKVVILIHGGNFTGGDKSQMAGLAEALAERGYVALSVNYTLAGDSSQYLDDISRQITNDIATVFSWIKSNREKYGLDADRVAIGGVSAGGYIAVEAAADLNLYNAGIRFFAVIDMYGGIWNQPPTKSSPPMLMIHGDKDTTVPIDSSRYLKRSLDELGIYNELFVMEGAGHGVPGKYTEEVNLKISGFLYRVSEMKESPGFESREREAEVVPGESFKVELVNKGRAEPDRIKAHIPEGFCINKGSYKENRDGGITFEVSVSDSAKVTGNHWLLFETAADKGSGGKAMMLARVAEPVTVLPGTRIKKGNPEVLEKYFTIRNSARSSNYSGSITVTDYSNEKQEYAFKEMKPGESREFMLAEGTYGYCGFMVKLDNGFVKEYTKNLFAAEAFKTDSTPKIDGSIDEWVGKPSFALGDKSQVKVMEDWRGLNDLSSRVWLGWDEMNLYVAAVVRDDVQDQKFGYDNIWNGDSIQFAVDRQRATEPGCEGTDEFGFALGDNGDINGWRWIVSDGHTFGPVDFGRSIVKRTEKDTVYEVSIPWSEILAEGIKPEKGMHLGFSYLANDSDGGARRGWIEFGSGIGGGEKDPYGFGDLYLM